MPGLSLSSRVEVFPCPNCRETINTSLLQCTFCGVPVDHAAALVSATETSNVSQACSDASYLKIMAWAFLTCFGLVFVPFIGLAGAVGLWSLRIALPVMAIRWWIKFGKIKTNEIDFFRAKQAAVIVSIVSVLAVVSAAFPFL